MMNIWKKNRILVLLLALPLFLAACQSTPDVHVQDKGLLYAVDSQEFRSQQQAVANLTAWDLSGSFSYKDAKEVAAGKIKWVLTKTQTGSSAHIRETVNLQGPLGMGAVTLYIDSQRGAVLEAGKQQLSGANAEDVLFRAIGWYLPVQEMRYWMYGVPHPQKSGQYWRGEKGVLTKLEQSGWSIRFLEYQDLEQSATAFSMGSHPRKVFATNEKLGLTVKLVTKKLSLK